MSWLLDPNSKSVAKNAQKIVINLHKQLEKQNKQINELENIIINLNELCLKPIKNEINELEEKKILLQNEINDIDNKIEKNKILLNDMNNKIKIILQNNEKKTKQYECEQQYQHNNSNNHQNDNINHDSNHNSNHNNNNSFNQLNHDSNHLKNNNEINILTKKFDNAYHDHEHDEGDEDELIEAIRLIEPNLLFILSRDNIDDIIVYLPPQNNSNELVSIYKLRDPTEKTSREEITQFERMMAYGPKQISNSDRDDPDMFQLQCPGLSNDINHMGEFIYSITLPIAPKIIIDIWKSSFDKYWATTTIDSIKFAVLESLQITSEVKWGILRVTKIELMGKHPIDGRVIIDVIRI